MENFKRSFKRLLTRLTILGLVVVCGAIAIAQVNKDRAANEFPNLAQPTATLNDVGDSLAALKAVPMPTQETPQWVERQELAQTTDDGALQIVDPNVRATQALQDSRFQEEPMQGAVEVAADRFGTTAAAAADRFGGGLQAPGLLGDDVPAPPENDLTLPAVDPSTREIPDTLAGDFGQQPPASARYGQEIAARPAATQQPTADQYDAGRADGINRLRANAAAPVGNIGQGNREQDNRAQDNYVDTQQPVATEPTAYNADAFGASDPSAQTAAQDRFGQSNPYGQSDNLAQETAPRYRQAADLTSPAYGNGQDNRTSSAAPAYGANSNPNSSFAAQPEYQSNQTYQTQPSYSTNTLDSTSLSGLGTPGPPELEGAQNPAMTIRKIAPQNVRVGQPVKFEIKVRNNSQVEAKRVVVQDVVPQGTRLIQTNPTAVTAADGTVVWELDTIRPGEEVTVSMDVSPQEEGVIGSVASVTFHAQASARADVKKPQLVIKHTTKPKVLVGETVQFTIVLENPGSGPTNNVVIQENIPQGLSHPKGPTLEYEVGSIPPGGQRRLELTVQAAKPGEVVNTILARAEGGLTAEHRTQLEVVAPELQVKIDGPTKRYLERNATFTVKIGNPGTADARNVELVTTLPPGMKFVSTNNSGRYDRATNSIKWSLDRLPSRSVGDVKFTAVPIQKGDYKIDAVATGDRGLKANTDHGMFVEGIAALLMEVADQVDPIEEGGVTSYNIRVENQGTKNATNVQFVAELPQGLRAMEPVGQSQYRIEGGPQGTARVVFPAIAALPAKGESTYTLRVKGVQAGDHRFRVWMTSDESKEPVIEEESTRVYAD